MARRGSRVVVGGLGFDAVTEAECAATLVEELDAGRGGRIHTANVDHLQQTMRDPSFLAYVEAADLVIADGIPIVWASRLQGTPLPARVAGSDLVWTVGDRAARAGRSVFLLGGASGTAVRAAESLEHRSRGLRIAGTSCPQLGDAPSSESLDRLCHELRQAAPDIVLVGLPPALVRAIVARCAAELPATWWIGVGVSFSFMAGTLTRAPRWQQAVGLEWLHRLAQEPARLAGRYMRNIPTALVLLACALLNRRRRRHRTPDVT